MNAKYIITTAITLILAASSAHADWLIKTYMNGSPINLLQDADLMISSSAPIATSNVSLGDFVGFNSGEGTGHFSFNSAVPGITQAMHTDNYAVQGTGFLSVQLTGNYTFGLNTDDGARLRIDGVNIIVDNVRQAPHDSAYATINLTAGLHPIEWTWYNTAGGNYGGGAVAEIFAATGVTANFNSNFKLVGGSPGLSVQQVPEPSSIALVGVGIVYLLNRKRLLRN